MTVPAYGRRAVSWPLADLFRKLYYRHILRIRAATSTRGPLLADLPLGSAVAGGHSPSCAV
jgi:hypothetical protein